MTQHAIILDEAGWGAVVVERINDEGRPVPVYRRVAAFNDREEARLYADAQQAGDDQ